MSHPVRPCAYSLLVPEVDRTSQVPTALASSENVGIYFVLHAEVHTAIVTGHRLDRDRVSNFTLTPRLHLPWNDSIKDLCILEVTIGKSSRRERPVRLERCVAGDASVSFSTV